MGLLAGTNARITEVYSAAVSRHRHSCDDCANARTYRWTRSASANIDSAWSRVATAARSDAAERFLVERVSRRVAVSSEMTETALARVP